MSARVPRPRHEWAEAAGRAAVNRRAAAGTGIRTCEVTGRPDALEWSHRVAAGRGGTYAPSNGVLLAAEIHRWAHDHPADAERLGWHLETGANPRTVPAWLARPWPGWWFLRDDDEPLVPAHREDYPDLPTPAELALLLPPAVRGALT